ncbi:hypothetical protein LPJ53_004227 [Coemansia erecta]|uniref:Uncharacterized protein n=1 Tax=Coemansia erecta TaxID=147472 RepID=A0A9W7XXJ8_9FUNG|nr:hypothetical protein LPJ53_004227 [Coemansia erecta]
MSEHRSTSSAHTEGNQSTGRVNSIIRKLSRKVTPPRLLSLRSRRGLPQSGSLDLDLEPADDIVSSAHVDTHTASSIDDKPTPVPASVERHRGSVREDSLRKREKIAELRRKRLNPAGDGGIDSATPSRAGTQLAALFRTPPRESVGTSPSAAMSPTGLSGTSAMPMSARQGYGQWLNFITPAEDGFFNSPELNLLLQQVDLDPLVESPAAPAPESLLPATPATPPADDVVSETLVQSRLTVNQQARSMRRANSHNGQGLGINAGANINYGESDFTINIPSTSLSPVVPLSARNLLRPSLARRRSRTVMQIPNTNSDATGKTAVNMAQQRQQHKQQQPSRNKHAATAYDDVDTSSSDEEDLETILRQLDEEKAINKRLHRKLAEANDKASTMAYLLHGMANEQASLF